MTDPALYQLAKRMAEKLRLQCHCQWDYNRTVVKKCSNCALADDLDVYLKIIAVRDERQER